jgi:diguanylate cyclase (GGDEF)-like protein/PAS domain S-box-containing protein
MSPYVQPQNSIQLHNSHTRNYYVNIFESAYNAIFVETLDGQIVDANPAACELLQYTQEEFLQMNISELIPPETVESVKKILTKESVTNGKSFSGYNIRKDGKYIPVEIRIRSFYQAGEQYLIVIAHDITESVELLQSEKQRRKYLASLHEFSLGLFDQLELPTLLHTLLQQTCDFFNASSGCICLLDDSSNVLNIEEELGLSHYIDKFGYTFKKGEGLVGKVCENGQPLVIEDYQNWSGRHSNPAFDTIKTSVGIPLKSGEKTIGVICLDYFDASRSFSAGEIELLTQFATLASIAFVNARLYTSLVHSEKGLQEKNTALTSAHEELMASEEELRQQFEQLMSNEEEILLQNTVLNVLHNTTISLMNRLDLDEVLKMITTSATDLLRTKHGFIYVKEEESDVFERKIGLGYYSQDVGRKSKSTHGLVGQVYKSGKIIVIDDYSTWKNRLKHPFFDHLHNVVQVPLKREGKVFGTIGLALQDPARKFTHQEITLLSRFAELASIALDNATLVTSYKNEIQEHNQTEKALQTSEEQNQALINAIPDLMLIIDRQGTLVDLIGDKEQLGFLSIDSLGKNICEVFPETVAQQLLQHTRRALKTGTIQIFEYHISFPDKEEYYEARIIAKSSHELLAIIRNITDRKSMELQLKYISLHDSLTGLYNRSFWEDEMKRFSGLQTNSAGLMICDVDGLKIINDSLGHATGDIILKSVADILKKSFTPRDVVARIGGDEFAILLPHCSTKSFDATFKEIQNHVDFYNTTNPTIPISLSLGFAISKKQPLDMNALFREADNNMYREKLHRKSSTRNAIVLALMKALEARDFITEGHGDRLQNLLEAFANFLNLPRQEIADLRLFSQFHDIGKVGIPDHILFKPSKLSEEEFVVMQQHCDIGYRIAISAPDLAPIANWILRHHEWWNGKGYPFGLKDENIPLPCRMLSIVDAFDAMTNDRPYRKSLNQEEAIMELLKFSGSQFDPNLVEPFITLVRNSLT